jgi:PKHD-type hydroxylase
VPPPRQAQLANWHPAVAAEGVFTAEECARIVELAGPNRPGRVAADDDQARIRDSRVAWIRPGPETEWIFARTLEVVRQVNTANFEIDIAGFTEPLQVAEYAPGQYYDWHLDIGNGPFSIRKLSFIAQLTDPATYEGGAVEIFAANQPRAMPRPRGSVILFPSYVLHRVAPVTTGTRRSLVGWIGGPHFR